MAQQLLKELIKEMEDRVSGFERNMTSVECKFEPALPVLNKNEMYHYWDGKRSEAAFMVEKLTWILENK